jgi:hypothetical protein
MCKTLHQSSYLQKMGFFPEAVRARVHDPEGELGASPQGLQTLAPDTLLHFKCQTYEWAIRIVRP